MARIAPTTITLDPAQTVTLDLKPNPELSSQTTALVALADHVVVRTPADSVEASAFLARVQHLRRWVAGIYKDAKTPLTTAKRTLDAQERALLVPLAEAEQRVMREIVSFQAQHQQDHDQSQPPAPPARSAAPPAPPAPRPAAAQQRQDHQHHQHHHQHHQTHQQQYNQSHHHQHHQYISLAQPHPQI